MDPQGSKWLHVSPNGSKWLPMAPHGSTWLQVAQNSSKWFQMAPNGSKWLQMAPHASQRQKYVGSARALLPGNFFCVRKVFALNILLFILFGTSLENHWSFWKVSELSGNFPDCLERFWIVWKVCVQSKKILYSLESKEGLDNFQIFW